MVFWSSIKNLLTDDDSKNFQKPTKQEFHVKSVGILTLKIPKLHFVCFDKAN